MMNRNRFHACATCINFQAEKQGGKMKYWCGRLGYETKSHYKFNCWDPKENVKKLIAKK
ncbi:hypothetical protein [Mesobacillus subterraneus]|uniref:hypothetical protein n=1 Tax=Mesobacillus subterraneus TaxID=285983 RepID=UPI0014742F6B|nr:hypothetical protein [Mesobacillus subterraneus]